jgi:hypothetical protein
MEDIKYEKDLGYTNPDPLEQQGLNEVTGMLSTESGADTLQNKVIPKLDASLAQRKDANLMLQQGETPETYAQRTGYLNKTEPVKEEKKTDTVFVDANGAEYSNPDINTVKNLGLTFASGTTPSWLGATPQELQLEQEIKQNQDIIDSANATLENQKQIESDLMYKDQIANIQNTFALRKKQMEDINLRRVASIRTSGIRSGSERYTASFGGVVSTEEQQGISRLGEIDAQQRQAEGEARAAQQARNWEIFDRKINAIEKLNEKKQTELEKLNKITLENNKKTEEENAVMRKQGAMADSFNSGITNPIDIVSNLTKKGIPVTMKEVTDFLSPQRMDDNAKQDIAMKAAEFGASSDVVQRINNARTPQEALSIASQYIQDPKLKYELQNLQLENTIRKQTIEKNAKEIQLLGEPSEKEKKATEEALKNVSTSNLAMKDKIDLVDALKTNSGLSSRVGTNFLSRVPTGEGFWGTVKAGVQGIVKAPLTLTAGTIKDIKSSVTGEGQNFAGGVHKLISGLSLQSLIEAKSRGATFGALSDSEMRILANSASMLNDWEIKDANEKGIGVWNIDEANFNKELDNIKMLTQRAITLSGGQTLSDEETSSLDSLFQTETPTNPEDYFQ